MGAFIENEDLNTTLQKLKGRINRYFLQLHVSSETKHCIKDVLQVLSGTDLEKLNLLLDVCFALQKIALEEFKQSDIEADAFYSRPNFNLLTTSNVLAKIDIRDLFDGVLKYKILYLASVLGISQHDDLSLLFNLDKSFRKADFILDKVQTGKFQYLSGTFDTLNIENLSDYRNKMKSYHTDFFSSKFDLMNSTDSPNFLKNVNQLNNPLKVHFCLQNARNRGKLERDKTYEALFKIYTSESAPIPIVRDFAMNNLKTVEDVRDLYNLHDAVLMPKDLEENQAKLQKFIQFLTKSNANSFDVHLQQNLELNPRANNNCLELVVDIIVDQSSRKPVEKRFRFRMHVVNSEVFEDAVRDYQINSLQLTYTYIFPNDCRMFIALPTHRDSYLNRKDNIDRS